MTYRRTPACSAPSMSLTAAPRSTVRLRAGPLPGPAPAAKTTASAPRTTSATSAAEACSRSSTTARAPSASRSATCPGSRTIPTASSPRAASSRPSRRAIRPCPPAMTTRIESDLLSPCLARQPTELLAHAPVERRAGHLRQVCGFPQEARADRLVGPQLPHRAPVEHDVDRALGAVLDLQDVARRDDERPRRQRVRRDEGHDEALDAPRHDR